MKTCDRCDKQVPATFSWSTYASKDHCTWECYYEDLYDACEAELRRQGLTGDALRSGASRLYLTRGRPQTQIGRPRKEARA